jgi:uncharacterized membrane-anchored protein
MKNLKFIALITAMVMIVLAVIARVFLPSKILFGVHTLTFLRVTVIMLLFALTFHFLLKEKE